MAPIDNLEMRLKQFPGHSTGWIEVENYDLSCFLPTKRLVLRKEGGPDVILGYCSGATDEEAAERCIQNILPHLDKLGDFLSHRRSSRRPISYIIFDIRLYLISNMSI